MPSAWLKQSSRCLPTSSQWLGHQQRASRRAVCGCVDWRIAMKRLFLVAGVLVTGVLLIPGDADARRGGGGGGGRSFHRGGHGISAGRVGGVRHAGGYGARGAGYYGGRDGGRSGGGGGAGW